MQSILASPWFPTAALICGLVFGVLILSCACLMIIKEQRPSSISILLAILGAFLLMISIWKSRNDNIDELKAKIAELEQHNTQLAKELEETSSQQRVQGTTLNDNNMQLETAVINLQNTIISHNKKIVSIDKTQLQNNKSLAKIQQQMNQQEKQIQNMIDKERHNSSEIQNQLKHIANEQTTKFSEYQHLVDDMIKEIHQLKANMTATSNDYSKQLENLEKQRMAWSTQMDHNMKKYQTELDSLQADIGEAKSQDQGFNLVQASTQRELSSLRREMDRLQENIQQLQSRRNRVQ